MVYTPNTEAQREEMLRAIGLKSVSDLYKEVPAIGTRPEDRSTGPSLRA